MTDVTQMLMVSNRPQLCLVCIQAEDPPGTLYQAIHRKKGGAFPPLGSLKKVHFKCNDHIDLWADSCFRRDCYVIIGLKEFT